MLGAAKYSPLPMNIITDGQLLDIIDNFRERFGVKETAFGRSVNGEPGLLPTLRAGRKVSLEMANRIMGFMKDHAAEHGPDWQMPSPDNAPENIGALQPFDELRAQDETSSPEGEPSGRAPAADSASAAAGVNISAGDAVASEMGEAA